MLVVSFCLSAYLSFRNAAWLVSCSKNQIDQEPLRLGLERDGLEGGEIGEGGFERIVLCFSLTLDFPVPSAVALVN